MEIEVGMRIQLLRIRSRQPDRYNQVGWEGVVTAHEVVDEAEAKASDYEIYEGENIFTIKWDNGYISDVYPENGDRIQPCGQL